MLVEMFTPTGPPEMPASGFAIRYFWAGSRPRWSYYLSRMVRAAAVEPGRPIYVQVFKLKRTAGQPRTKWPTIAVWSRWDWKNEKWGGWTEDTPAIFRPFGHYVTRDG